MRSRNRRPRAGRSPDGRNGSREVAMRFRLVVDGESREVEVNPDPKGLAVRVDGVEYLTHARFSPPEFVIRIGRRSHRIRFQGRAVLVDEARHEISIPDIEV